MTRGKCWYCGEDVNPFGNYAVEHILPLSRGGSNDIENLAPCCTWCNQSKGTRTVEEFRAIFTGTLELYDPDHDGQGMTFWFEEDISEPPFPHCKRLYTRREWRDLQIYGYHSQLSNRGWP